MGVKGREERHSGAFDGLTQTNDHLFTVKAYQLAQASERVGSPIPASQQG